MGKGMVSRLLGHLSCALGAILLLVSPLFGAIDDLELGRIVVTPSRIEEESTPFEGDVEVLSGMDLEDKSAADLSESLDFITGVDVIGGGTFGSVSQGIYIRGAQTRHTAYMFNGVKLYDPSNTSGYYVPSDFLTLGLDRIEVVKTPLSSLYGSSPMGGAINFITKEPRGKPYIYLESQGGSFSTSRELVELGGRVNGLSYLFNAARLDTDGFSKAKEKNNNPEDDPYQNTNLTLNLVYDPEDDLKIGLVAKGIHSRINNDDDDDYNGLPEDDLDNVSWNNELVGTAYAEKKFTDFLSYKIQAALTSLYRRYYDDNDGHVASDNYVRAWYKGKTYQLMNHFEITPCEYYKALVGFDYTREWADSYRFDYSYLWAFGFASDFPKSTTHSKGIFIENIFTPLDSLKINFSYRYERQPIFKDHSVMRGKIGYVLPKLHTEVYGSYSEGFKAPSLYQLCDPARGNSALRPEDSKTWEAGFRQPLGKRFSFSASYFHSDFRNLIDFVYTDFDPLFGFGIGQYVNAASAKSRGVEFEAVFDATEQLYFKTGYTYLKGRQDFVDDDFVTIFSHRLIRTPKHKAFFEIGWDSEKFDLSLDISYVGKREDRIWQSSGFVSFDTFAVMKPYLLGNIHLNYKLRDNVTLFLKVHNIFDKDYEQLKGYQEERASAYAGLKTRF